MGACDMHESSIFHTVEKASDITMEAHTPQDLDIETTQVSFVMDDPILLLSGVKGAQMILGNGEMQLSTNPEP